MNNKTRGAAALAAAAGIAVSIVAPSVGAASVPPTEGVDLAAVCPDPVVVQTDWFPEAEHGSLYELLGADYTVDADNKVVVGPLHSQGAPTGVDVEIRAGGPAIGASIAVTFYADDSIMLAYASTDNQVLSTDTPRLSVLAPLEKNPQIIMWDPETYPEAQTIADLGESGVTINVFGGQTFTDIFVAEGVLSEDQIDPSYDGGPSRFIGEGGQIAQQGFASAEPYQYEHAFTDWGRPVAYELIHDAGFEIYSQTLAIRPDDLDTLRPCLELLVPVIQQSTVDYITDPERTNAVIVDVVEQFDTFWEYSPEVADFSVEVQRELGLTGNGPDGTLGNMESERVQGVIDQMADAGLAVPEGLTAEDIVTNEFIDESIGL